MIFKYGDENLEINEIAFGTCDCLGESIRIEAEYNENNKCYICPYCNQLLKDLKVYNF